MTVERKAIIANTGDDSLTIVDLRKDYEKETIFLPELLEKDNLKIYLESFYIGPYDLCPGNSKEIVYTANTYSNTVFKVDIKNKKIIDIVTVGSCPTCIKSYDGFIYVSNTDSNSISILDEEKFNVAENIPVGEKPWDIQIEQKLQKVFVVNSNDYSIDVIDLKKEKEEKIILDKNPIRLCLENGLIYILTYVNNGVLNTSNISILRLDTFELVKSIDLKGIFNNMIKINEKDIILLTSLDDGHLYILDVKKNKIIKKLHIGGMPNKIVNDGDNILFITNVSKNILSIFNLKSNKVENDIEVGVEPNGLIII